MDMVFDNKRRMLISISIRERGFNVNTQKTTNESRTVTVDPLFLLEQLPVRKAKGTLKQCERSVRSIAETDAVAVAVLYHLGNHLSSDRVNAFEFSPVDLLAFCSARIAEVERSKNTDLNRQIKVLLAPFSSIMDIEEIIRGKI